MCYTKLVEELRTNPTRSQNIDGTDGQTDGRTNEQHTIA